MQRLILLLLFVLLPLAGCGGGETTPETAAPDTTAQEPPGEASGEASGDADRLIRPASAVGAITPASQPADLLAHYGAEALDSVEVHVGEGATVAGTELFAGTPDALTIEWKAGGAGPERITIAGEGTRWHTEGGLTVGTPLEDVERLNGGPFLLTGFQWDYAGRTLSWEGGAFPDALQLALRPTREVAPEAASEVAGDVRLRSDHPVVRDLGLVVDQIFVRW